MSQKHPVYVRENEITAHYSPGSVGDLCVFCEPPNILFKDIILIVITSANQKQEDDIWRRIMEQSLRIHGAPCTENVHSNYKSDITQHPIYSYTIYLFLHSQFWFLTILHVWQTEKTCHTEYQRHFDSRVSDYNLNWLGLYIVQLWHIL